jgi:hypothetical protein
MDKIDQQIKRFEGLDIWDIVKEVINREENVLINLVKEQLTEGETKTGKTKTYSPNSKNYVEMKLNEGRIKSSTLPYMNLYNEGNFYEQLSAVIKEKTIEIFSNDGKAKKLEDLYGNEIYIPNEQRMIQLKLHILPIIQKQIREQLGY